MIGVLYLWYLHVCSLFITNESTDIHLFLFVLVIETPSAPTKPSAPVAATRQDVYAGKWQYFLCSVTHEHFK